MYTRALLLARPEFCRLTSLSAAMYTRILLLACTPSFLSPHRTFRVVIQNFSQAGARIYECRPPFLPTIQTLVGVVGPGWKSMHIKTRSIYHHSHKGGSVDMFTVCMKTYRNWDCFSLCLSLTLLVPSAGHSRFIPLCMVPEATHGFIVDFPAAHNRSRPRGGPSAPDVVRVSS